VDFGPEIMTAELRQPKQNGYCTMRIVIIEPYFAGSHAAWAEGYQKYSQHDIEILSLPGQFWKWRMQGGAVTLARQFLRRSCSADLILATDMLNLPVFLSMTRHRTATIPTAIYFHENQLSYPWAPQDRDVLHQRHHFYGFINYASALVSDAVFFNSNYHRTSFLDSLPRLLRFFPDYPELDTVPQIAAKSQILSLGLDLERLKSHSIATPSKTSEPPLLLWNHRWEHDKNPEEFFRALWVLQQRGLDFRVAILGQNFRNAPVEFEQARQQLGDKIVQFGFVENMEHYAHWLHRADILPVTSCHDFFGASIVEAVYCGCYPLLPNRLAYPEIFSIKDFPGNFYYSFEDLIEKLSIAIKNIDSIRKQNYSAVVQKYDWKNMAKIYDERFATVAAKREID